MSFFFCRSIGKTGPTDCDVELSLTVPIVNTLAFLFTVIGEWWVEKKVISRGMHSPFPVGRKVGAN